jgi:DNA-binding SARP family transcriptional activator
VDICLLGSIELRAGGRSLPIRPPQCRAVLAAIAVDAPRPVTVDTLIHRDLADRHPHPSH